MANVDVDTSQLNLANMFFFGKICEVAIFFTFKERNALLLNSELSSCSYQRANGVE